MSEARELNHSYVGTEHLLLGLLREEKGIAAQVLTDTGVNLEAARAETLRILGTEMPQGGATAQQGGAAPQQAAPKGEKKSKTPALDHFCRDLTQLAAEGLSNREIGHQFFLSPRTVVVHLYHVFPKLGISSRNQLHIALRGRTD